MRQGPGTQLHKLSLSNTCREAVKIPTPAVSGNSPKFRQSSVEPPKYPLQNGKGERVFGPFFDPMYPPVVPFAVVPSCPLPAINAHPRQGIFIPQAPYEARESDRFYTASTVCTLSRIFSDSSLIQPSWSKVATSPWGEAARVTGGYGERSLNGANSLECPDFMFSKVGGLPSSFRFRNAV